MGQVGSDRGEVKIKMPLESCPHLPTMTQKSPKKPNSNLVLFIGRSLFQKKLALFTSASLYLRASQ